MTVTRSKNTREEQFQVLSDELAAAYKNIDAETARTEITEAIQAIRNKRKKKWELF